MVSRQDIRKVIFQEVGKSLEKERLGRKFGLTEVNGKPKKDLGLRCALT